MADAAITVPADFALPSFGDLDVDMCRDARGVPTNRLMTIPSLVDWDERADRLDLWGTRIPGGFLRDLATAEPGRQFILVKMDDGRIGIAVPGA